ncbi:MAG: hypothetical protein KJO36_06910 [Acidimicrobiia bacterium]|nr:hypothetical protein [Acidimicrobiia bacterium]NNC43136.1 hypothetical protein [Acidimicrobiia bacterium]
MKRIGATRLIAAAGLIVVGGCSLPEHQESFGYVVETVYETGIPADQQVVVEDGVVTREELEMAVVASLDCMDAIDGVMIDDPFHWRDDGIEFGGGAVPEPGVDEDVVVPMMDDCYYEHAALVETAWFDQEYFGSFSFENKR